MEADTWRGTAPNNGVASQRKQTILILNQNSTLCAANKCDALLSFLKKSFVGRYLQEECNNALPAKLSSVPDLIQVRCSVNEIARELIQSCKEKWNHASIIVVLCAKWNRLHERLRSLLTKINDFLSCPFYEAESLLRVRRLLVSKGSKAVSSEKPGTNKHNRSDALVGKKRELRSRGAIRGMGEKFAANRVAGTGSMMVHISANRPTLPIHQ